jgi:uncharacterized membrane protein YGL010W
MTLIAQYRTQPERVYAKATNGRRDPIGKCALVGWIISIVGTMLLLYGYFEFGSPPLIDWHSAAPLWIAKLFGNIECEMGMTCGLTDTLLISWPHLR